jgi:hypothetical protein
MMQLAAVLGGLATAAGRDNLAEPKPGQIEFVDKDVDDTNWIVLADPVFHALREQSALPTVRTLNEALHPNTPANHAGIIPRESQQAQRFHTAIVTS